MISESRVGIGCIMRGDPSITELQRSMVFDILDGRMTTTRADNIVPKVLSRRDVAIMLNIHPKRVDLYSRNGTFKRFYLPGAKRAAGILRSSVEAVLEKTGA